MEWGYQLHARAGRYEGDFGRHEKNVERTAEDSEELIRSGERLAVGNISQTYDNLIRRLLEECRKLYGTRFVSFCVFGSAGRGTVTPDSDIDFLTVAEPFPQGRRKGVEEYLPVEAGMRDEIADARKTGIL